MGFQPMRLMDSLDCWKRGPGLALHRLEADATKVLYGGQLRFRTATFE